MSDIEAGDTVERIDCDSDVGNFNIGDVDVVDGISNGGWLLFKERHNIVASGYGFMPEHFKKVKEQQMKPKNKEEALRMMDELKKYIEEEDKPVWTADDIKGNMEVDGRMIYGDQEDTKFVIIGRINFIHDVCSDTFISAEEVADFLNKQKCTKA